MEHKRFFEVATNLDMVQRASNVMLSNSEAKETYNLGVALRFIAENAEDFDKGCSVNIALMGDSFISSITRAAFHAPPVPIEIDKASVITYRFLTEYDVSTWTSLPIEMRDFMRYLEDRSALMDPDVAGQITFAQTKMLILIQKNLLNSRAMGNVRDLKNYGEETEKKIQTWDKKLAEYSATATRLSETLENQATAFNFIGLSKGFSDMELPIAEELKWAQKGILFFGVLVIMPGLYDIYLALDIHLDIQKFQIYKLIATGIGTFTLTLLFLYFFRITLRKADSCRARLMQVRLRMTICKFIQSYADYSHEFKEKNPKAFLKFEALIFSGIVDSTEKLPSTFDGLDQVSNFAKALNIKV